MANEEHLAILQQGVEAWNTWRTEYPDTRADLSRANLIGANLRLVHLIGADLSQVNLSEANLSRVNLNLANLSRANLSLASLSGANLSRADLSEANLSGANLSLVNLSRADLSLVNLNLANLSGADLSGAQLGATTFAHIDLSTVMGLDSVQHRAPSTIGIDTLYASHGKISESFLRSCGVPKPHIDYLPALIGAMQPIQFYSCFISYSSQDDAFARRLHERMRAEHLRVWFAPEDIKGGEKLHEQIEEAIRVYD